jgi:pimeloyl-ACP methyl ester carboxylesterase
MSPPSVLMLPGMMLDARLYAHQRAEFAHSYTTVVGDLTRSSSISELAQDVLRDAPSRFALIGLSMGGIIAFEVWRQASERVTHIGLLDTTFYSDRPERRELRLEQIAQVEMGGLREVTASLKPLYLSRKNRENPHLLQAIMDMGLELGSEVFRRQSLALRDRRDSIDTLPTITCPALILCGREDQLCPMDWHVAMANAIPKADLVVLADCGHLSAMEEPEAVTASLERLLRRHS